MIWEEQEQWLLDDNTTHILHEKVGDIDTFEMDDDYLHIWKDISFQVQLKNYLVFHNHIRFLLCKEYLCKHLFWFFYLVLIL